jgi:MYXO-CTERM domain-containing protein
VEFHVTSERLTLNVLSQSRWSQPLERGRWYEFLFHVRWSSDPGMGFAELWVDGQAALQRTALATAFPGMRNYLKVGYYRDASIPGTGTVYVDGMVSGPTRADVLPAPASQAADSGAPATAAPPPVPTSPGPVLTAGPETRAASSAPPPPSGCAAAPAGMVALAWALRRRRHVTGL